MRKIRKRQGMQGSEGKSRGIYDECVREYGRQRREEMGTRGENEGQRRRRKNEITQGAKSK